MFGLIALLMAADPGPLRYYPERAQREHVEGTAVINCLVTQEGTLTDCNLVSETPPGYGFGDKALEMSKLFKKRGQKGEPTPGTRFTVPINFKLPR
jgi:periplasmic protein TonB